jgi:DNA-binding response OmpR family regulator
MAVGRLLVLDDDPSVGRILVAAAEAAGFEARLCAAVEPFFAELASWAPTHAAVDLTLPGTTGVEVLGRVAEVTEAAKVSAGEGSARRPRIIIFSGAGRAELDAALAEAARLGLDAAGVLPKPFRLAQLRALLQG